MLAAGFEAHGSQLQGVLPQEMNFKTALGRAVYNIVFHPPKNSAAEAFQPMRTAFVYDLDEIGHGLGIPTTLRRSKADCPKVRPR